MGKPLTTDNLVKTVKRRAMLPTEQVTFTKSDFIDIINEEMDLGITEHIMKVSEEYLVYYEDLDLVSGKKNYKIPSRAIGNKLRGALLIASDSTTYELSRVELEDLPFFQDSYYVDYDKYSFYVQNDELIFINEVPTTSSKLRMYFYIRPSYLVEDKYSAVVQSIDTNTGTIVVDKIPNTFDTSKLFDFTIKKVPNKILSYDIPVVSINSATKSIVFNASNIPDTLEVGDYLTLAGESIVPQTPVELHPLLAQRAAVACLEAIGDTDGLNVALRKLAQIEKSTLNIMENRVESASQKVNNLNSPLRSVFRNRRGRRGY